MTSRTCLICERDIVNIMDGCQRMVQNAIWKDDSLKDN